jgi:hypothetical protein
MARTPEEVWNEIYELDHGIDEHTPYRETMLGLAAHNDRLADLWTEIYEAAGRDPGAAVWAINAAGATARRHREDAKRLRREAER